MSGADLWPDHTCRFGSDQVFHTVFPSSSMYKSVSPYGYLGANGPCPNIGRSSTTNIRMSKSDSRSENGQCPNSVANGLYLNAGSRFHNYHSTVTNGVGGVNCD